MIIGWIIKIALWVGVLLLAIVIYGWCKSIVASWIVKKALRIGVGVLAGDIDAERAVCAIRGRIVQKALRVGALVWAGVIGTVGWIIKIGFLIGVWFLLRDFILPALLLTHRYLSQGELGFCIAVGFVFHILSCGRSDGSGSGRKAGVFVSTVVLLLLCSLLLFPNLFIDEGVVLDGKAYAAITGVLIISWLAAAGVSWLWRNAVDRCLARLGKQE